MSSSMLFGLSSFSSEGSSAPSDVGAVFLCAAFLPAFLIGVLCVVSFEPLENLRLQTTVEILRLDERKTLGN